MDYLRRFGANPERLVFLITPYTVRQAGRSRHSIRVSARSPLSAARPVQAQREYTQQRKGRYGRGSKREVHIDRR